MRATPLNVLVGTSGTKGRGVLDKVDGHGHVGY